MPRNMSKKYDEAFRVCATTDGIVSYYGPYATVGAAKGQLTGLRQDANRRYWSDEPVEFDAHIEKSSASWERVE